MQISSRTTMIITGGARGFGRALIDEYGPKGVKIFGTYITSVQEAKEIEGKYPNVIMSKIDNQKPEDIEQFIKTVVDKQGKIDVLVNNAGSIQERKKIVDLSLENFRNLINIHTIGTFVYCKNVLPYMIKRNKGVIVNIGSRFGLFEWAKEGFSALNVAKAGVNMLTKVLFQELRGTKIRINSVLPAPTITNFLVTIFSKEEIKSMKQNGLLGEKSEFVELVNSAIENEDLNGEFIMSERLK